MAGSGYIALAVAAVPVIGGIVVAVMQFIEKRKSKGTDDKATRLTLEQQQQIEFHKNLLAEVLESRKTIATLQTKILEVSKKSFMSEAENLIESSIVQDLRERLKEREDTIEKVKTQRDTYRKALAQIDYKQCDSLEEISDDIRLADEANSKQGRDR